MVDSPDLTAYNYSISSSDGITLTNLLILASKILWITPTLMYKLQIAIFFILILAVVFGLGQMTKIKERNKAIQDALYSLGKPTTNKERQRIADNLKQVFEKNKLIFDFSSSNADDGILCAKINGEAKKESSGKGAWSDLKTILSCL